MRAVLLPGDRLFVELEDEEGTTLTRRVVIDFACSDERRLTVSSEERDSDVADTVLLDVAWATLCR